MEDLLQCPTFAKLVSRDRLSVFKLGCLRYFFIISV